MADRFMKGTLILTAAGLMVKILGSVNRILLSRLLGGEGIGLYQIAYPLFLILVALSSAGIPAAVSIMVSHRAALQDRAGARKILGTTAALMAVLGLGFALLAWNLVPWLLDSHLVKDARACYAMLALVPAIGLSIPIACFRGYFQGFQEMVPTGASQIVEQFTRVVCMLAFAYLLLPKGLEYGAAGASLGALPGAVTCLGMLLWFYYRQQKQWERQPAKSLAGSPLSAGTIAKNLAALALPVTCANLMVPVVSGIEIVLVPERLLAAGFTVAASTRALGYLSGMAMPLVNMGTIPTNSLAQSVVPAIAQAKALGQQETIGSQTARALRFFLLLNLPAAVGVYVLGTPIARLLYGTIHAGPVVTALAPAILFLGLHQVTTAVLQGLGHTRVPMCNMLLSLIVKIGLLWVLTAEPAYNIRGAAWATDANLALAGLLNLLFLFRRYPIRYPLGSLLRPMLASAIMGTAVWGVYRAASIRGLPFVPVTMGTVALGALVYLLGLLLTGELTRGDLDALRRRRKSHERTS